jgi:hypothetical protein
MKLYLAEACAKRLLHIVCHEPRITVVLKERRIGRNFCT